MALIMQLITLYFQEIRYAAAYTLRILSNDRCACNQILQTQDIVENLLKMIKNEHSGIVLLHLKTMENLTEWDQVEPIKQNAFQIMRKLFGDEDERIVCGAMDCMAQICKHDVGRVLADNNDITFVLRPFLVNQSTQIFISATGLMSYTTLTTRSRWRAKQVIKELSTNLIRLLYSVHIPLLQYRVMQVLINLCDCPDIRHHLKRYWLLNITRIAIKTHEEWDGTMTTTTMGLESGHNYRTMCIETVETIRNDWGDTAEVVNVHSYLRRLQEKKEQLIAAINWKCYK